MLPEIQSLIEHLQDRRAAILKTLDGLPPDALDWTPLPGEANSLAVLAVHSLGAERRWLHQVVGEQAIVRDRAAEFRVRAPDVAALRAEYAAVARGSEQILARLQADELEARRGEPPNAHTARWAILHVLEHYAEHAAQMGLTRQLWEKRGG